MVRMTCAERPNDWDKYLPALLGPPPPPPFEQLYGRNARGPMQILRELWSVEDNDERVLLTYQYVIQFRGHLKKSV